MTWLNLEQLIPEQKDCLLSRLALRYDNGTFYNAKGVDVNSNVDFGGAGGVAYVDPNLKRAMPYFGPMIDNLTDTLGYQIGVNLHGAGYDWRLGPKGHMQAEAPGGYFEKLRNLIEDTVARNGNRRSHLVTHSLGGPTTLAFLQIQGKEWVSKYVETFIPLSGPWIGGASMALTEVGGDNLGEPIPHDYLMPVQREAESGVFIMPYGSDDSAWGSGPMVITPSRQYTVDDMPQMFLDLGLTQTYELWTSLNSSRLLAGQLEPPTCDTHVMYSTGVSTGRTYTFKNDFKHGTDAAASSTKKGDGDGTVNIESLMYAERTWKDKGMASNLTVFTVTGVEHIKTVSNSAVLDRIIRIVTGAL